jgi:mersacidin/lichenicidin family type 2 lantibiotic
MNKIDVIRAWKDPVYRAGLSRDEVAGLPGHPAGFLEIDEEQLKVAAGAVITTFRTCTMLSFNNWRSCCPP